MTIDDGSLTHCRILTREDWTAEQRAVAETIFVNLAVTKDCWSGYFEPKGVVVSVVWINSGKETSHISE